MPGSSGLWRWSTWAMRTRPRHRLGWRLTRNGSDPTPRSACAACSLRCATRCCALNWQRSSPTACAAPEKERTEMLFELRQYRILPGRRPEWATLMDEVIVPFQTEKGMDIVGTFL